MAEGGWFREFDFGQRDGRKNQFGLTILAASSVDHDLHERKMFPRHIDPFESVFPQSLPVERRQDEVEHWKNQIVAQELKIAEALAGSCELPTGSGACLLSCLIVISPTHSLLPFL